jgi:hypothetical protein
VRRGRALAERDLIRAMALFYVGLERCSLSATPSGGPRGVTPMHLRLLAAGVPAAAHFRPPASAPVDERSLPALHPKHSTGAQLLWEQSGLLSDSGHDDDNDNHPAASLLPRSSRLNTPSSSPGLFGPAPTLPLTPRSRVARSLHPAAAAAAAAAATGSIELVDLALLLLPPWPDNLPPLPKRAPPTPGGGNLSLGLLPSCGGWHDAPEPGFVPTRQMMRRLSMAGSAEAISQEQQRNRAHPDPQAVAWSAQPPHST